MEIATEKTTKEKKMWGDKKNLRLPHCSPRIGSLSVTSKIIKDFCDVVLILIDFEKNNSSTKEEKKEST